MTKTLKLEVSVDNIGENGAIASTFATTEFVQTELNKKVNLTPEGKVDHTQLPDYTYISGLPEALEDERILREEAEATTLSQAKTYSDQKLSETAAKKADLIDGKVPFTQLPYNINLEQNIANEFIAVRDEIKQTTDGLVSQIATLDTDLTAYVDSKDSERKDYIDRALFTFLEDLDLRYNEASTRLQGEVDAFVAASQTKVDAEVLKLKKGEVYGYDSVIAAAIGGYPLHARIRLDNGDIVKSTVANNTVNPNTDMTGWVKVNAASQIFDASGKTQQEINGYRPTIFQIANVVGDGIVNDTVEIQKSFRYIDNNKKSYIFLPFFSNNYFIDAPIVLQEPAGVIGDKSPTYNRGGGKDGWILVGPNATHAFDFGNYRTYDPGVTDVDLKKSRNQADTWFIRGIGVKKHPSVTASRTKDGLLFTSKTDGPDRSITVQEFSATGLNRAIYVPVTAASVSSASFNISNCNISNNNYGIYHEARSYSTLIEKNQIEQNSIGGIYGCFDGVTVIRDNMLEGQPNAITLANHTVYKSQSQTLIESNYFEVNSGDYVIKMEGIIGSRLTLRNNWILNNNAAEYCLIGTGTNTVLENYDLQLVTIENNVSLRPGTKLTALPNYSINYKKTASSGVFASIRHEPKDLAYTNDPAYKPILPSINRSVAKFQNQLCYVSDTNAALYSATPVTIGDILEVSVLLYCDTAPPAGLSVYLVNNSQMIASFSPGLMGGKWLVTTFVVDALSTQPQIYTYADIEAAIGGVGIKFAAASIKNHGQVALNSKINVKPCIPKLNTIAGKAMYKAAYTGFTLAAGATKAATLHQFTTPEGLAIEVGDLVKAGLSVDLQGLDIYAEATTNGQVKVWFKNNTSGSITIADSTLRIIAF